MVREAILYYHPDIQQVSPATAPALRHADLAASMPEEYQSEY
jgi:hypothetical protein